MLHATVKYHAGKRNTLQKRRYKQHHDSCRAIPRRATPQAPRDTSRRVGSQGVESDREFAATDLRCVAVASEVAHVVADLVGEDGEVFTTVAFAACADKTSSVQPPDCVGIAKMVCTVFNASKCQSGTVRTVSAEVETRLDRHGIVRGLGAIA